jgi:LPS-assembly protein
VPYYWNIAPNRDATLAPRVITRRGLGWTASSATWSRATRARCALDWLPNDRWPALARRCSWQHEGALAGPACATESTWCA